MRGSYISVENIKFGDGQFGGKYDHDIIDIDSSVKYLDETNRHLYLIATLFSDRIMVIISSFDNNGYYKVLENVSFMLKLHPATNKNTYFIHGGINIIDTDNWDTIQVAVWQCVPPYSYLIFDFTLFFKEKLNSWKKETTISVRTTKTIKKKISLFDLSKGDDNQDTEHDKRPGIELKFDKQRTLDVLVVEFEETLSFVRLSLDLLYLFSAAMKAMIFRDYYTEYHVYMQLFKKNTNSAENLHFIIVAVTSCTSHSNNTYTECINMYPTYSNTTPSKDDSSYNFSNHLNTIERDHSSELSKKLNVSVANIIIFPLKVTNKDLIIIERSDQRIFITSLKPTEDDNKANNGNFMFLNIFI